MSFVIEFTPSEYNSSPSNPKFSVKLFNVIISWDTQKTGQGNMKNMITLVEVNPGIKPRNFRLEQSKRRWLDSSANTLFKSMDPLFRREPIVSIKVVALTKKLI